MAAKRPAKKAAKRPRKKTATKKPAKRAAKKAARRKSPAKPSGNFGPEPPPPGRDFTGHSVEAEKWARDVIAKKIPACKWIIYACKRHFRNVRDSKSPGFKFFYDPQAGGRVCQFAEKLPHVKGKWARTDPLTKRPQTIKLEGWQKFTLCMIFGWRRKDNGKRRFTRARIYVPRKNGKSILAAIIGLYMLTKDHEPGAEVYSGATSEKQAWEVFGPARQMLIICPWLARGLNLTVNAQSLVKNDDGSKFLPVIGKPGDGPSPHCAITDEYHEHKTSELIDTMETGMGARDQPLSLVISTAGADVKGPCREDWKECEKLLANLDGFEDDETFAMIFTIDARDKWDTLEALEKANPNFGVSINAAQMEANLKAARQSARKQAPYKTKYLNQWVSAKESFFNVAEWEALAQPTITPEDFKQYPCYLAGDLASKCDLVALMQLFCLPDERFAVFGKYYLPANTIELAENQHYRNWQIKGHIEAAGDDVTDLDSFKADTLELCAAYQVEEMPSDPNRAWGVFPALVKEGVPVVEYRNTVLNMSEPMKQLEALIKSGRIIHNGDPVLTWAISNVTAKLDKKDNVFPNKENTASKIDPVVGLLMALGRAMLKPESPQGPVIV